jgi:hypothetical protein
MTDPFMAEADSLDDLSAAFRSFIDSNCLGSGNVSWADILRGNVLVARISYNGRIWPEGGTNQ